MLRLRVSYQAVLQLLSPLGSGDTLSSPGPSAPWVLTATAGLQDLTTSSASPFQRTPSAVLPPALGSSSLPAPHVVASPGCGRRALQHASRVSRAAGCSWLTVQCHLSPSSGIPLSSGEPPRPGHVCSQGRERARPPDCPSLPVRSGEGPHARSAREVGERHERCGEREWRENPPTGAGKPGRWDDSMTRCTVSAQRLAHSGPVKTISHCCPPETAPPYSGI